MTQKVGFGSELQIKERDGYQDLVNSYVRVDVSGGFRIGYLEHYTPTDLYLKPSIVDESLNSKFNRRIERDRPLIIPLSSVIDVQPVRKGYIGNLLKDTEKLNEELRKKNRREELETRVREAENRMKINALNDFKKSKKDKFNELTRLD